MNGFRIMTSDNGLSSTTRLADSTIAISVHSSKRVLAPESAAPPGILERARYGRAGTCGARASVSPRKALRRISARTWTLGSRKIRPLCQGTK